GSARAGQPATETCMLALMPSLMAVIVVDPGPAAVTRPLAETVAIASSALDHVNVRPASSAPAAERAVAANWCVSPTSSVSAGGPISTEATGTGATVTVAVPLFPSDVAVIVTGPPGLTPVTIPPET